jgi:hypothetical protein
MIQSYRLEVVKNLLTLAKPLPEVSAQLSNFVWDYDGEGLKLTRSHLCHALERYLDGTLSAIDVETWANLIETREDIYFDADYSTLIDDVLHELANPTLTQSLDSTRSAELLDLLSRQF